MTSLSVAYCAGSRGRFPWATIERMTGGVLVDAGGGVGLTSGEHDAAASIAITQGPTHQAIAQDRSLAVTEGRSLLRPEWADQGRPLRVIAATAAPTCVAATAVPTR